MVDGHQGGLAILSFNICDRGQQLWLVTLGRDWDSISFNARLNFSRSLHIECWVSLQTLSFHHRQASYKTIISTARASVGRVILLVISTSGLGKYLTSEISSLFALQLNCRGLKNPKILSAIFGWDSTFRLWDLIMIKCVQTTWRCVVVMVKLDSKPFIGP